VIGFTVAVNAEYAATALSSILFSMKANSVFVPSRICDLSGISDATKYAARYRSLVLYIRLSELRVFKISGGRSIFASTNACARCLLCPLLLYFLFLTISSDF